MILGRDVRERLNIQGKPFDAEFSRVVNGVKFYYKKCKVFPWLNYRFSYVSNCWVLDN